MEVYIEVARPGPIRRKRFTQLLLTLAFAALVAGCASEQTTAPPPLNPTQSRRLIEQSLPPAVIDRPGWAADMYAGFATQAIAANRENICAVVAVIEQESGFRVDPIIPGLAAIAQREIDRRADTAHVPRMIIHGVLELNSSNGHSYSDRLRSVKTEKELSDIFEDFIGKVPLGQRLFAGLNPVRTRGPMQVNIAFAERYAASKPYPYPVKSSIADEVFTRRGSLYFGIAHLLSYRASYDRFQFRFADFNAGQYASRNAAFQNALSTASGIPLVPDGALLPHDRDLKSPGSTELAARTLAAQLKLDDDAVHSMLELAKDEEFERTRLYQGVFSRAEQLQRGRLPYAIVPRIKLQGPKIERNLSTAWYAHRVDARFERCLNR